ncbi:MAG: hypothetical protein AAFP99_11870 [Pseudomonadota bacterium]
MRKGIDQIEPQRIEASDIARRQGRAIGDADRSDLEVYDGSGQGLCFAVRSKPAECKRFGMSELENSPGENVVHEFNQISPIPITAVSQKSFVTSKRQLGDGWRTQKQVTQVLKGEPCRYACVATRPANFRNHIGIEDDHQG